MLSDNRLEQGHFAFVEWLVVQARDADDAAVDLAGEGHENELADSDPEQIALVQLRLLEVRARAQRSSSSSVRALLGR